MTFFKQKENIEKFLKFCESYGVVDRFSTPYLYQKQNVMAVRKYLCIDIKYVLAAPSTTSLSISIVA